MKIRGILIIAMAMTLLASACSSGSTPAPSSTNDSAQCNGGAFPDDAEFRQLICDVQGAELNVMGANGELDIAWGSRLTGALSKYSTDRAAAVSELQDLRHEIDAAIP